MNKDVINVRHAHKMSMNQNILEDNLVMLQELKHIHTWTLTQ